MSIPKSKNAVVEMLRAAISRTARKTCRAYFWNGRDALYSMGLFADLRLDPAVAIITDGETGEIIFERRR